MDNWWPKLRDLLIRFRIRLTFFIFIALLGWEFYRGVDLRPVLSPADWLGFVASLMVLFGAFLRSWSAGVIHKVDKLATTGPYTLFRHPLYLGSLNIALGLLILINEPINLLVLLGLILLVYVPKITTEERLLAGIYKDEWTAFKQRTGFFFPKVLPRGLGMKWQYSQWVRNTEYWGMSASLLVLALLWWLEGRG